MIVLIESSCYSTLPAITTTTEGQEGPEGQEAADWAQHQRLGLEEQLEVASSVGDCMLPIGSSFLSEGRPKERMNR